VHVIAFLAKAHSQPSDFVPAFSLTVEDGLSESNNMCEYFFNVRIVFIDYYECIMKYIYKHFIKATKASIYKPEVG